MLLAIPDVMRNVRRYTCKGVSGSFATAGGTNRNKKER